MKKISVKIDRLEEKDLERVMEIWLHTNVTAHSFVPADYWKSHYEEVEKALPEAEVYVARSEENGQEEILGFLGLSGGYIAGLFVAEAWQSHGIGKELTDYVKRRKDSLELHVFAENQRAVRFYKREGFRIQEQQLAEDTGKLEYRMDWEKKKRQGIPVGSKAGIVCCSNGLPPERKETMEKLSAYLRGAGLTPVPGSFLYQKHSVFSGTGRERAESLMNFYRDPEIRVIFDVSGGDLANEILPFLDFDRIAESGKEFWGYSDLTTVLNAIYAKTGRSSVLYQVRNLISDQGKIHAKAFENTLFEGTDELFDISYEFLQQDCLEGILIGGNIRCLLKLAGTEYWPDMDGKILLLEALGGDVPKMATYLSQLNQLHVFDQIGGILLGTFTEMEKNGYSPSVEELVKQYTGGKLPIAKTWEIGHGKDAKAVRIGAKIMLNSRQVDKSGKQCG